MIGHAQAVVQRAYGEAGIFLKEVRTLLQTEGLFLRRGDLYESAEDDQTNDDSHHEFDHGET